MSSDNHTKICGTCKRELPIDQFNKNKRLKDGLHRLCKQCCHDVYERIKDKVKARYQETKEYRCAYSRQYRLDHLDHYRETSARYYQEHRAERLAYAKEYRETHKEERAETMRAWRQRNQEHRKLYKRAYKAKNPEKVKLSHRLWARANSERRAEYRRQRHVENPDIYKVKHARRRARKLAAGGSFTSADIQLLYKNQRGKCWYCEIELHGSYDIDHRIPISRGGSSNPSNLVLTCNRKTPNTNNCNQKKQDKLPHEWNGRLL